MPNLDKLEVVYVINGIKKSGPNQVLLNMVKGIDSSRFNVTVISFLSGDDPVEVERLEVLGARCINVGLSSKADILKSGSYEIGILNRVIEPSVIHSHGILSDIAVFRANTTARLVSTIHNNIKEDYLFTFGRFKAFFYVLLHAYYLKKFDDVVNCSKSAWDANRLILKDSVYIRNGIDIDSVRSSEVTRSKLNIPSDAFVFVYSGKISERKGVLLLLEAFSRSHRDDEYLIILGEGDLMEECRKYEDESIRLLGAVDDVVPFLKISDAYASASHSEGFSISIIEALALGLRLLLSDIPSHREIVSLDPTVYLGECFRYEDFSLRKALVRDSVNSKRKVVELQRRRLSATAMMKDYQKLYLKVGAR